MYAAAIPEIAAGRHDARGRIEPRASHGVGALTQRHGHRAHRVFGDRAHVRDDHDAHDQAGREHAETRQAGPDRLQDRGHEEQREVAIDDRRHTAQQLEDGLGDLAHRERRELGKVDRDDRAHGDRHGERHGGGRQRAGEQRQDAVARLGEKRRPHRVGEEGDDRHFLEERQGLPHQDEHDAQRGCHRDESGEEEDELDHPFLDVAAELVLEPVGIDTLGERRCGIHIDGCHRRGSLWYRFSYRGEKGDARRGRPLGVDF